jgi:prepilin-type N-terminal cleavage/methylation domain-containing protein
MMKLSFFGFTLIELLAVIAIMGALSVVVIPHLDPDQGFKAQFLSDQIVSTLSYARQRAIATGCAVRVVWNTTTALPDLYHYVPCNSNAQSPQLIYDSAEGKSIAKGGLPRSAAGSLVPSPPPNFYFDALGEVYFEASPATRFYDTFGTVYVTNSKTQTSDRLIIDPLGFFYASPSYGGI